MRLILYSKPGCHLCEGLQEKLEQVNSLQFELEIRDITSRDDWFRAYQYEIPVLVLQKQPADPQTGEQPEVEYEEIPLPRPSPRASVQQLTQLLQKHLP